MLGLRCGGYGPALLALVSACGSPGSNGSGPPAGDGGAGPDALAEAGPGGQDASADAAADAPASTVPQDPPRIVNHANGPVVAAPKIVPVFFASDEAATPSALLAFLSAIGPSSYWTTVVSEYGVGPATIEPAVQLTAADNPAANVDDSTIASWLAAKLDASDPAFPPADENTVYALFYPPGTSITFGGAVADGYHTFTAPLDAGHGGRQVPYLVIPRLAASPVPWLASVADFLTFATSHEMVEATTDPLGTTYALWDDDHAYWGMGGAEELADACEGVTPATARLGSYVVARVWSNQASSAGQDPCVPAPAGEVYVNAAPELHDDVPFTLELGSTTRTAQTKGVHIPVGQSAVVPVDLFGTDLTPGPWTVSAQDQVFSGPPQLELSLDRTTGTSGDRLMLTIHVLSAGPGNSEIFQIVSTRGGEMQGWLGIVGN